MRGVSTPLFPALPAGPPGLRLIDDLLDPEEEAALIAVCEALAYRPFVLRGQASLRGIAPFGVSYGTGREDCPPIPPPLLALRDRSAGAAGLDPAPFVGALVNRYPPGAGIGWHRDYPSYGPVVLGVSLGAAARLRLRPKGAAKPVIEVPLARRSLYVLGGAARTDWEHSVPAVDALRISVTFRTLARGLTGA